MNTSEKIIDVSIVIPCYQEEGHILESAREIIKCMSQTSYSFELIFVDDFSADKTRDKIIEIENLFSRARHLFIEKNSGKGNAIAKGAEIAKGKFICHIDIDLEVSAEYIPQLLAELENGNDIALVNRNVKHFFDPTTVLRNTTGVAHRKIVQMLLGIPHTDVQSGCKAFRKDVLHGLLQKTKSPGWFFDVELIVRAYDSNYKIKQILGNYVRNKKKRSTVKLFSDGIDQFKNLLKFAKEIKKEKK